MGPYPPVVARTPQYRYVDTGQRYMEVTALQQIMRHWFGPFERNGSWWHCYPSNYVSIDIETTGFSPTNDYVIELGWTTAVNRQAVEVSSILVDWSTCPGIDWGYFCHRMATTAAKMAERGRPYHFTPEMLRDQGLPFDEAMARIRQVLDKALTGVVVAHNGWQFDRSRLNGLRQRYIDNRPFNFHETSLIDTGLFEKASQQSRTPWAGETLPNWYSRAAAPPWNIKWSLEEIIIPKYGLDRRYGLNPQLAHRGAFDSRVCHHAFETFRDIGEGVFVA